MNYDEIIRNHLQSGHTLSQAKDEIAKSSGAKVAEEAINSFIDFSANQVLPYIKQMIEQNYSVNQAKEFLSSKAISPEVIEKAFNVYMREHFGEYVASLISQGHTKKTLIPILKEKGFESKYISKSVGSNNFVPIIFTIIFLVFIAVGVIFFSSSVSIDGIFDSIRDSTRLDINAQRDTQESVISGTQMPFFINTFGSIDGDSVDVILKYEIIDQSNRVVFSESKRYLLRSLERIPDSVSLPIIDSGRYTFKVTLEYLNKKSTSQFSIDVVRSQDAQDSISEEDVDETSESDDTSSVDISGFPIISESDLVADEQTEEGVLSVRNSINIPNYSSKQDLINAISSVQPSLAFYYCGRLAFGDLRDECFDNINLDYELLGETDFCENVVLYNEQAVCIPKQTSESVNVCEYISNEEAKQDCNELAEEYEGTLEIIMELIAIESDETYTGRRLIVPWSYTIQSLPDYE